MKHAKKFYLTTALVVALAMTGCSNQSDEKAEAPATEANTAATAVTAPVAEQAAPPVEVEESALSGTVLETFDSAGYTYLHLDTGSAKLWAAIGQAKVAAGDKISLLNGPVMKDFHSKTLDRTFPEIIFSAGLKEGGASPHGAMGGGGSSFADAMMGEGVSMTPQAMMGGMGSQESGGSTKAVSPLQEVKVEKIEGGYSVEELFASAGDLAGKKVKIRGKAVKVSPNIMGRTWVHLQDGTGSAMNNSHDLVVTTNEIPEVNSVIVMEGTLAKDKDFGAGYFYNVIVEEAVIVK